MEPMVLHHDLIIWNGTLLAPGSSVGHDGSQQQATTHCGACSKHSQNRSHLETSPVISTGCSTSTAHPHCSTRLGQCSFTDRSKRKHFCDKLMVEVLDRTNKRVQYQNQKDLQLEKRHGERQEDSLRLAA
ncbi:unnamed protein product [Caretta caretta]